MGQTTLSESLRAVEAEIAAGRPDRAMALGMEVQSRYPRALAVQRLIGEIYLAQRKTREAIGALDRALAGNPEDARACCARAIVQQIHGNSMAALEWYRRACDINPDDQVLRSAYRELASHLGQPPYQPTRMGLARLYLRGDLFPHAVREFESLLAEQPDSLEAQVGLAETLWRAQRTQAAEERCRRILLNAPSCLKATLILAAIELDAGHSGEAERLVRRAAELDPDQRMGRTLFADRLAAGDRSLRVLLLGPEPQPAYDGRIATAPLSQSSIQAAPNQRFAQSQPLQAPMQQAPMQQAPLSTPQLPELPAQRMAPLSQPTAQISGAAMGTGPLPGSITGGPGIPAAPSGRSTALPPDFHSIFAETEYMLWGSEDERTGHTRANPAVSPGAFGAPATPGTGILPPITSNLDRSRVEPQPPFARTGAFVPPVLRDQGFNMEETEARAAINWINWLQAQGARAQGMPGQPMFGTGPLFPPPAAPTAGPSAAPVAPPQSNSTQPVREAPEDGARHTGMPGAGVSSTGAPATDSFSTMQTGPLPPAEELRAMFAQLQPDTSANRTVEGASAPPSTPIEGMLAGELFSPSESQHDEFAASAPIGQQSHDVTDLYSLYQPHDDEHADAGDTHEEHDHHSQHDEPEWAGASAARASGAPAPVTLESLERGYAESGFQPFRLPADETSVAADGDGALASMSSIRDLYGLSDEPSASPEAHDLPDAIHAASSGAFSFGSGEALTFEGAPAPAPEPEPEQRRTAVDDLAPDDHPARLERARQRRSDGQIDDALTDYRHILRNAPDMLGDVVSDLEETMADAPDHPEIHRLLGDARIRQGDYLSALESYNRAVALTHAQGS